VDVRFIRRGNPYVKQRELIEQQIQEALAAETSAVSLSNRLFSQGGLFSRLAATEEERIVIARSDLFREAQQRVMELRRREADEFARAVEYAQSNAPEDSFQFKLEDLAKQYRR